MGADGEPETLPPILPALKDYYSSASSRGHDRLAAWLGGMIGEIESVFAVDPSGSVDVEDQSNTPPSPPPLASPPIVVSALNGFKLLPSLPLPPAPPTPQPRPLKKLALDAEYNQIKPHSFVAIEMLLDSGPRVVYCEVDQVDTVSLSIRSVSNRVTVLTLKESWIDAPGSTDEPFEPIDNQAKRSDPILFATTIYAQAEERTLSDVRITSDVKQKEFEIELDGPYRGLDPGRWLIISGERTDNPQVPEGVRVSELLMISSARHEARFPGDRLHTVVRLASAPSYSYKRDTVKIYGNVVRATHGQTQDEVLGSGDGGQKLQSFQLKQSPITYLAAPTSSGAQSTLEVRVNDALWREADNLFALGANDRSYITTTSDDAKTSVVFGNGEHGARLPTGSENVKAVYRFGIGKPGNVNAEQIKLPLTRPLGVKDVINPLPASGGADRETRDQARRNAPIGTLALDRLVSAQDYADFARTFAGIGKASAVRLSDGFREVVHLTIAGAGDVLIDQTSDLYRNLKLALKRFGDSAQPLNVDIFERALLVISAKLKIHPDYLLESVKPKIKEALLAKLGFESRELGQDVAQGEVISVIQSVPGVVYVDLELLDSVDDAKLSDPNFGAGLKKLRRVNGRLASFDRKAGKIKPAQLVFLSPTVKETLILEEVAQ